MTPAGGVRVTVADLADSEHLPEFPSVPYPAEGTFTRKVASNGLVSVRGNRYSTPLGVIGTDVTVCWRLGDPTISIFSAGGRLVATHWKVPRGQGRVVRLSEHTAGFGERRVGGVHHQTALQTET